MEENKNRKIEELEERVAELERKLNETLEKRVAELEYRCERNKEMWDTQLEVNSLLIWGESMTKLKNKIESVDIFKDFIK